MSPGKFFIVDSILSNFVKFPEVPFRKTVKMLSIFSQQNFLSYSTNAFIYLQTSCCLLCKRCFPKYRYDTSFCAGYPLFKGHQKQLSDCTFLANKGYLSLKYSLICSIMQTQTWKRPKESIKRIINRSLIYSKNNERELRHFSSNSVTNL